MKYYLFFETCKLPTINFTQLCEIFLGFPATLVLAVYIPVMVYYFDTEMYGDFERFFA